MTAPAVEKLEEVLRRIAIERALAAIDPEMHGAFRAALGFLRQPVDCFSIRALRDEFMRLNAEPRE